MPGIVLIVVIVHAIEGMIVMLYMSLKKEKQ